MIHYIFLFFFLILSYLFVYITNVNSNLKSKLSILISFIVFIVISAFRTHNVGNDTIQYMMFYERFSNVKDITQVPTRFELGFVYLNYVLSRISNNTLLLFGLTSCFIFITYAKLIYKYSVAPWLSIIIFLTNGLFAFSLSGLRQALAISIIIWSYELLRKKKDLYFILVCGLAFLFHSTAILFCMAPFILRFSWNRRTILLFGCAGIAMYVGLTVILGYLFSIFPSYGLYEGGDYFGEVRLASIFNFLIISIVVIFASSTKIYKKTNYVEEIGKEIYDNKNMLLLVYVGMIIELVSFKFNLIARAGLYFTVFSIIVLPNAIMTLKSKSIRTFAILLCLVGFFSYQLIIQIYRPEWNNVYPIELIFFK